MRDIYDRLKATFPRNRTGYFGISNEHRTSQSDDRPYSRFKVRLEFAERVKCIDMVLTGGMCDDCGMSQGCEA